MLRRLLAATLCALLTGAMAPATAIINGRQITDSEWSFMVAIGCSPTSTASVCEGRQYEPGAGMFSAQFCAGALIAPTVVATAAHCLETSGGDLGAHDLVVAGGSPLLSEMNNEQLVVPVTSVLRDPEYDAMTQRHDLALLRLARAPIGTSTIDFARPEVAPAETATARLAGWGDLLPGGPPALAAQEGLISLYPDGLCQITIAGFDPASEICGGAHTPSGWVDACRGDSGGPLISTVRGKTRLIGLVSWGRGCATGVPGVYTQISSTLPTTLMRLPTAPPLVTVGVRAISVTVRGEPWSTGVWPILAQHGQRSLTCAAVVTMSSPDARCTISGIPEGGAYVITIVPPYGAPPAVVKVTVKGPPAAPRVSSVSKPTNGRSFVTFMAPRSGDAVPTGHTVRCSAGTHVATGSGPGFRTTVRGLVRKLNYACVAYASNMYGVGAKSARFTVSGPRFR